MIPTDRVLTRRTLLAAGAAGLAAVAAGCGSSGGDAQRSASGTAVPDLSGLGESQIQLAQRFPTDPLFVPGDVRLAFSLFTDQGGVDKLPAQLQGEVVDDQGKRVAQFRTPVRSKGLPLPYIAVRTPIARPGVYTVRVDVGGKAEAAFQVFAPEEVGVPYIGSKLPGFDTPTTTDGRGVDPICTLDPPCPFHAVTLNQALASGKPVVYMVGTPAHCSTGACAPGLEFLVTSNAQHPGKASIVHAEVYTNNLAQTVAPAVQALKIGYEPVVYFADPSGVIVDRLDAVWDATELAESLARVGVS